MKAKYFFLKMSCGAALLASPHWALANCPKATAAPSQEYAVDGFVLQYELSGPDALENQADTNRNNVPDLVEDAATQFLTMKRLMLHFGFTDPVKQARYQSRNVQHVQVRFLDMKGNGLAYDEPAMNAKGDCVLQISLSNKLTARNLSPAHEWFHLVQYGYTPFKRPWFLEGMARWSESALRKDNSKSGGSKVGDSDLFAQSYDAVWYWAELANASSESKRSSWPRGVRQAKYLNGDPVIQDEVLIGPVRMRKALESLASLGAAESKKRQLDPYNWPESVQRLPEHDAAMKQAIESNKK